MRNLRKLLFVTSLILTFASVSWAAKNGHGTPDGQPPANETVCDGFNGAAFGLCNAYCEAMDCDSENPHASAAACNNAREHFMRKTGFAPPCEDDGPGPIDS